MEVLYIVHIYMGIVCFCLIWGVGAGGNVEKTSPSFSWLLTARMMCLVLMRPQKVGVHRCSLVSASLHGLSAVSQKKHGFVPPGRLLASLITVSLVIL